MACSYVDDEIMVASNVTPSGLEKHIVDYFLATFLLYCGYGRKGPGRKAQGVRCLASRLNKSKRDLTW